MDENPYILYRRAIESKLEILTTSIAELSSPHKLGAHLVEHEFLDLSSLNDKLEVHGDGPQRKVQRLLSAVVAKINTAPSPESCAKCFDSFVRVIGEDLQMGELAQNIINKYDELKEKCPMVAGPLRTASEPASKETTQPPGQSVASGDHLQVEVKQHQFLIPITPVNDDFAAVNTIHQVNGNQFRFMTEEEARREYKHLLNAFISLVKQTRQHLKSTGEDLDDFRDEFLLRLPLSILQEHDKFFAKNSKEFDKAETYGELFVCLNRYWNRLNYNLLECIIEQRGNEKLKEEIKKYSERVCAFRKSVKLEVFWKIETSRSKSEELPKGFKRIITKHSITSQSTLHDLECIRLKVASEYHLQNFALIIVDVVDGSVVVTWLVPSSVVGLLLCGLTKELMNDLHLTCIYIVEDDATECKVLTLHLEEGQEILRAAAAGDTQRVGELVGTTKEYLNITDEIGETALMLASKKGHTEAMKLLLEAGADFNAKKTLGETALMLASKNGHTEAMKLLLEAGADFNAKKNMG